MQRGVLLSSKWYVGLIVRPHRLNFIGIGVANEALAVVACFVITFLSAFLGTFFVVFGALIGLGDGGEGGLDVKGISIIGSRIDGGTERDKACCFFLGEDFLGLIGFFSGFGDQEKMSNLSAFARAE